ncbi:MAG: hypothetical protein KQI35_17825 [Bacteroidetes bacterium]|nr:hypothetical protein [Bacteroidota bacterium]
MKSKFYFFFLLLLAGSILIGSCKKKDDSNDDNNNPPVTDDKVPPQISVTSPTSDFAFLTTESNITIKGVASDDKNVNKVKWENNQGQSGTATGTTSWELSNASLTAGDNLFTFIAYDDANNTDTAKLLVTYNEVFLFTGPPVITPDAFFVNTDAQVQIKSALINTENVVENGVKLIQVNDEGIEINEVCELFDDGDLSHGDDIQSDGVFSNIQYFFETVPQIKYLRVKVTINDAGIDKNVYSEIKSLSVVNEILQTEVEEILDVQLDADQLFQSTMASSGFDEAIAQTLDYLEGQSNVTGAGQTASGDIWIEFEYGLPGMILTTEEGNEGGSSDKKRATTATVPISQQSRGVNATYGFKSAQSDENAVLDKDVMLFAPNWVQFNSWGTEFLDNVNNIIDASECPNFDIDYMKNEDANLEAIRSFYDYGLIVIHTHGGLDKNNNVIFLTGDEVEYVSLDILDWLLDRIMPIPHQGKSLWAAKPSYIAAYNDYFPNSIVYNGSCESAHNTTMSDAFINKGASTYFGFSETVKSWFDRDMANQLFPELITNNKSTGEAFVPGQHDNNDPAAYFVMIGNDEAHFASDFANGDFEEGDLTGWNTFGDGRVITQLGFIAPYGGNFMGIISTGLGYTTETGSISQNFCVPEGVTTLTLNWNYLSEEFLEWVGSGYQDYFQISVIDEFGFEDVLYYKSIDDIYNEFPLTLVSPDIVFDQGDVYYTDWQYLELDISLYAGTGITLVLSSGDVGDSIYDTAILLDDITIY